MLGSETGSGRGEVGLPRVLDEVDSVGNNGCPDHLRLLPAQRLQRNEEKLPVN